MKVAVLGGTAEWALAFSNELQRASPLDQDRLHASLQRWILAAQENIAVSAQYIVQTGGSNDAEAVEYEIESLSQLLGDNRCLVTRDSLQRICSLWTECCRGIGLHIAFPESGYPSTRLAVPTIHGGSLLTWREARAIEQRLLQAELSDDARGETGCVLRWLSAVELLVESTLSD
jgi:hypothetical protein